MIIALVVVVGVIFTAIVLAGIYRENQRQTRALERLAKHFDGSDPID